jgi:cell division protein FtsA
MAVCPEEIIHVLPQEFKIDGQSGIKGFIGMYGRLESSFHVVVGQASSIRNVVFSSGMEHFWFDIRTISIIGCSFVKKKKEAGVALIDIGGGTTDLAIFTELFAILR